MIRWTYYGMEGYRQKHTDRDINKHILRQTQTQTDTVTETERLRYKETQIWSDITINKIQKSGWHRDQRYIET